VKHSKQYPTHEVRLMRLRDSGPSQMADTPEGAQAYARQALQSAPWFNPDKECLIVMHLNTRRRVTGFHMVAIGTLDSVQCHPREVFADAILGGAQAVILVHNHPSGETNPSEADICFTRDLIRGGQLLKIEVLDHLILALPAMPGTRG
jgi:DNA repair protein RadC